MHVPGLFGFAWVASRRRFRLFGFSGVFFMSRKCCWAYRFGVFLNYFERIWRAGWSFPCYCPWWTFVKRPAFVAAVSPANNCYFYWWTRLGRGGRVRCSWRGLPGTVRQRCPCLVTARYVWQWLPVTSEIPFLSISLRGKDFSFPWSWRSHRRRFSFLSGAKH